MKKSIKKRQIRKKVKNSKSGLDKIKLGPIELEVSNEKYPAWYEGEYELEGEKFLNFYVKVNDGISIYRFSNYIFRNGSRIPIVKIEGKYSIVNLSETEIKINNLERVFDENFHDNLKSAQRPYETSTSN